MLGPMRLVAVSIVKNEADIIEPFIRHTRAWVDHHLVFDHDSSDGTREILGALQAEGLPLTLFTDQALGNLQQARSNRLTSLAARDHGADWILPLDADEILTGPGRPALEKVLAAHASDRPATLPLLNYFPTEQDNAAEENPILRLQTCQARPPVPGGMSSAGFNEASRWMKKKEAPIQAIAVMTCSQRSSRLPHSIR